MEKIDGGVNAPKGFQVAGIMAGVKKMEKKDMALVYSEVPAVVAGVFTTNVVKASPVKWDIRLVKEQETAQAVVLNSGIANAVTGSVGDANNERMAQYIADGLNIDKKHVLTASTGVIGVQLPMDVIQTGCEKLVSSLSSERQAATDAAEAIMTTDTICKETAVQFVLSGKTVTLAAMTKGSGMIHPNMATMLCTVTTDAAISKDMLQKAMNRVVNLSFNMISVDRDTSTNDSYMILANGMAGNDMITEEGSDFEVFCEALQEVSVTLAKLMAGDGEGATKLFETKVIHADTEENAKILAKSVITSNLVKTAVYGSDANWGRIFCAMGYSGVMFDPDMVDLYIESSAGTLKLVENGMATGYSEEKATEILSKEAVTCVADMKAGEAEATAWGCDLTYDYVKINGDYRS